MTYVTAGKGSQSRLGEQKALISLSQPCLRYYLHVAFLALAIATYIAAPVLLITGWTRWARLPQPRDIIPMLALAGFIVGSASALLALGAVIYAWSIGGFPYYDPRLLRIYGVGLQLSLAGLIVGLLGLARPSSLRWHAPILSLAMIVLWLLWMQGE